MANEFKGYEFHASVCGDRMVLKLTAEEADEIHQDREPPTVKRIVDWVRDEGEGRNMQAFQEAGWMAAADAIAARFKESDPEESSGRALQTRETREKLRTWLTSKPAMGWVEDFRITLDTCDALEHERNEAMDGERGTRYSTMREIENLQHRVDKLEDELDEARRGNA